MDPWEVKTELEKKWPRYSFDVLSCAYEWADRTLWTIYALNLDKEYDHCPAEVHSIPGPHEAIELINFKMEKLA
jgi:hypothetical protein